MKRFLSLLLAGVVAAAAGGIAGPERSLAYTEPAAGEEPAEGEESTEEPTEGEDPGEEDPAEEPGIDIQECFPDFSFMKYVRDNFDYAEPFDVLTEDEIQAVTVMNLEKIIIYKVSSRCYNKSSQQGSK